GLGLKTASLSQCRKLIVASRSNPDRREISAFCWDLNHVEKTNRWEILALGTQELGPEIRYPLQATTGTVVVWRQLDRILGLGKPEGGWAQNRLLRMCRELEEHLAMVFHRFLAGEVKTGPIKITLNGNEVLPWDPYARDQQYTQKLTVVPLHLD